MQKYTGFDFMRPLVESMTANDPSQRPTMDEVVARFQEIKDGLPWWTLRRPVDKRWIPMVVRAFRKLPALCRAVRYMVAGVPAVPDPPSTLQVG